MAVVPAFTSIVGTDQAGTVAYYRAPDCNLLRIADILPKLNKINHYEAEYVIGELLIWDDSELKYEPNNCTKVRVIVYNDGWICAWFDKTITNQIGASGLTYVNSTTLSGYGSSIQYSNELNGMLLKITANGGDDIECPVGTIFTIRSCNMITGEITIHSNSGGDTYHFNSGYTYNADIYMTNGNLLWYGFTTDEYGHAPSNSNRLYRALILVWDQIKYSSNSSNWIPGDASYVYRYDSQLDTYSDEKTNFNDIGSNDCQLLPSNEVINDAFYIGYIYKFSGVTFTMGTSGIGSGITWEYWDGAAWTSLSCVDGTGGFTTTGELTFNPPDNWNEVIVNGCNSFWIRARVTTASYTTTPILTQGQLYKQDSITFFDTMLGLYNFEYPGANYILIMGMTGGWEKTHSYYYYTILPGKTLFNVDHNIGVDGGLDAIVVNDQTLFNGYGNTDGHIIRNGLSLDLHTGIQNVISTNEENYNYRFTIGTVIIVS